MEKKLRERSTNQMNKNKFTSAYKNGIYKELYQRKHLSKEELNRLLNKNK